MGVEVHVGIYCPVEASDQKHSARPPILFKYSRRNKNSSKATRGSIGENNEEWSPLVC